MSRLDTKIVAFIDKNFPDLDYDELLGANANNDDQRMGLNYEYFVNAFEVYSMKKSIDVEDAKRLSTGSLKGIDSVFLIVNRRFFYLPDKNTDDYELWVTEFDDFCKKHQIIEATYYFIQSKAKKTNLGDFTVFCDSVYEIFSDEESDLKNNPKIATLLESYSKISKLKDNSISLTLKFCAINKDIKGMTDLKTSWEKEIKKKKEDLKSTKFDDVTISFLSGQDYQKKLDAYNSPNKRTYEVNQIKVNFIEYEHENVISYIGLLTLKDVITLLKGDDDLLDSQVFFDNIRYYEGRTPINSKIERSLNTKAAIFHTLHNGIIITASSKHFNKENGNLEIESFSVVNGCQTCNIIWNWFEKNEITEEQLKEYKIPAKIIITENSDIRSQITEAANSQNEIKSIQLISISDNAKLLQSRLGDLSLDERREKLVYERLTNQFPDEKDSTKITTEDVFRAFYSTFGKEPHQLKRSYGKYLETKLIENDFLADDNKGEPKYDVDSYLISSIAFNYLERYIISQHKSLRSLNHHLLLLFFISFDKEFYEKEPTKHLDKTFVNGIIQKVADKEGFEGLCREIINIVIEKMPFFIDNSNPEKPKVKRDSYYTEENTKKMIEIFKENFFPKDAE